MVEVGGNGVGIKWCFCAKTGAAPFLFFPPPFFPHLEKRVRLVRRLFHRLVQRKVQPLVGPNIGPHGGQQDEAHKALRGFGRHARHKQPRRLESRVRRPGGRVGPPQHSFPVGKRGDDFESFGQGARRVAGQHAADAAVHGFQPRVGVLGRGGWIRGRPVVSIHATTIPSFRLLLLDAVQDDVGQRARRHRPFRPRKRGERGFVGGRHGDFAGGPRLVVGVGGPGRVVVRVRVGGGGGRCSDALCKEKVGGWMGGRLI